MALSKQAMDVLATLECDSRCYVDFDTPEHLSIELPPEQVLTGAKVERARTAWGAEESRVSIEFNTHRFHIKKTTNALKISPCDCELPEATTPTERAAVDFARSLGVIDYDDLVPQYELSTCETHTNLNITGLLHVIHDTLQQQVDSHACTIHYRMADGSIAARFPRVYKRKRGDAFA